MSGNCYEIVFSFCSFSRLCLHSPSYADLQDNRGDTGFLRLHGARTRERCPAISHGKTQNILRVYCVQKHICYCKNDLLLRPEKGYMEKIDLITILNHSIMIKRMFDKLQ